MPTSYRVEQVGSFLRPPALLAARAEYARGQRTLEELRAIEDQAILDVLAMQRAAGVEIFSDGELRRGAFLSDLAEAVDGFVPDTVAMEWHGPNASAEASAAEVVGARLSRRRRLTEHEVTFLQAHSPGPFKMTVPSPCLFTDVSYKVGVTDRFYESRLALLTDIAGIVGREVTALADEGVPYIQLDAPRYTYYVDPRLRAQQQAQGIDPDEALDRALAADVSVLAGARRPGVSLAIHLCRGNSRSRWFAEGGYEPIAEKLFTTLPVDAFLLEYDSDRSGGFEPLRFVPPTATVVLGLVTTKEPMLESEDELIQRIKEAERYVPLDRLALSPQCGFASVAGGNLLTPDDQRRKLELVTRTVREVWG